MPITEFARCHSSLIRAGLIAAFSCVLSLWLVGHFLEQQRQTYGHNYGQALADVAAYQAQEATLDNDLLSLQVVLEDISANPGVIGATIHDVENRLLVQGGFDDDRHHGPVLGSYTAPITLNDSVAGYVTLTLAPPQDSYLSLYLQLGLILLASCGGIFWSARQTTEHAPAQPTTVTLPVVDEATLARTERKPDTNRDYWFERHRTALRLHAQALPRLKKQLSSGNYRQLLDGFERQLRGICSLYSGELVWAQGSEMLVLFEADNALDASFNALCASYLLQQLQQFNSLDLELALRIDSDEQSLTQRLRAGPPMEPVTMAAELIDEQLTKRARFDGEQLLAIESPWADMIAKQRAQLQRLGQQALNP